MNDIGETSDGYHTFNELYEHRIALFIALCSEVDARTPTGYVWRSKLHSDGTMFDGWFVMGIGTEPGEQITYHLPLSKRSLGCRDHRVSIERHCATPKKKSRPTSPSARSLAECRKRGWTAQVVEHFNTYTNRRVDLFGIIDIVVITPDGILGVQATSGGTGGNSSHRRDKALAEPRLLAWLKAGGRFAIWSWAKRGDAGKRKLWTLREVEIRVEDFGSAKSADLVSHESSEAP